MEQEQEIDLTSEINDLIKHYETVMEQEKEQMDSLRSWIDMKYENYLESKKVYDEAAVKLLTLKAKLADTSGDDDE